MFKKRGQPTKRTDLNMELEEIASTPVQTS